MTAPPTQQSELDMPIGAVRRHDCFGRTMVAATLTDGRVVTAITFDDREYDFDDHELIGLTVNEARELERKRSREYLAKLTGATADDDPGPAAAEDPDVAAAAAATAALPRPPAPEPTDLKDISW